MAALAHSVPKTWRAGTFWFGPVSAGETLTAAESGVDPEQSLVERCLRGDESAWEELAKTYTRRVYSLCYRFTGNEAQAQELTQEVFLRVFKNLKSFRAAEGSLLTWLSRLTRNLLIDHYRRSRLDRATDSLEEQLPTLEQASGADMRTEGIIETREASEIIHAGLRRLSPELREAVILRDLEQMEYREIARVLNVPEGTVKSRLNRGRAELARVLRRQGAVI